MTNQPVKKSTQPEKMNRLAQIFAIGAAFFIALGFSAAEARSQEAVPPLDFAQIMPEGARFYEELDARANDADKKKSFQEFLDLCLKKLPSKIELPSTEATGFRVAVAVYGPAKVHEILPGFLALFEVENAAGFEPLFQKFKEKLNFKGTTSRVYLGWKIDEDTAPRYAGWAKKGRRTIFSSHSGLLQATLATIEGKKLPEGAFNGGCLGASSIFQEAFKSLPAGEDRVFIDLEGIVGDIDPFLTIFGGDTYQAMKKTYLEPLRFLAAVGLRENGAYRSEARIALKGDVDWLKNMSEKGMEIPSLFSNASYFSMAVAMPPEGASFAEPVWGTFAKFARKARHAQTKDDEKVSDDTVALHDQLMKNLAAITEVGILVNPSSRGIMLPVVTALLNTRSAEAAAEIVKMFPGESLACASAQHWVVYSDTDRVQEMMQKLSGNTGMTAIRKGLFALSFRFPLRELTRDSSVPDVTWQGRADWRFSDGELRGSSVISPDPVPALRAAMIVGLFAPTPREPDQPAAEPTDERGLNQWGVHDQPAPVKIRPQAPHREKIHRPPPGKSGESI